MAKEELGTKRVCPETGRKFYDLNRDPIVSPYSGHSYPLSFFEAPEEELEDDKPAENEDAAAANNEDAATPEIDADSADVELVSLEDADDETAGVKDIPELDDDDDDIGGSPDDNTFLETDDDENDDLSDIVVVSDDGDDS